MNLAKEVFLGPTAKPAIPTRAFLCVLASHLYPGDLQPENEKIRGKFVDSSIRLKPYSHLLIWGARRIIELYKVRLIDPTGELFGVTFRRSVQTKVDKDLDEYEKYILRDNMVRELLTTNYTVSCLRNGIPIIFEYMVRGFPTLNDIIPIQYKDGIKYVKTIDAINWLQSSSPQP